MTRLIFDTQMMTGAFFHMDIENTKICKINIVFIFAEHIKFKIVEQMELILYGFKVIY